MKGFLMRVLRGYNPDTQLESLIGQLIRVLRDLRQQADAPQNVRGLIMALQADVQALVDKVTENTSAVASMKAAFDLESKQIADQGAQIAALQAQLASVQPGQPIDAEDLAAIQDSVAKIDANNKTLSETNSAVSVAAPANTPPETSPSP